MLPFPGGQLRAKDVLHPHRVDAADRTARWCGLRYQLALVVISPIIAGTIAKASWSKSDVKRYLFEHARLPAWEFERQLRDWNIRGVWDLKDEVTAGRIPKVFYESDGPDRKVPIVWEPEDLMIAVSGDPRRNNAYVFAHNAFLGYPVRKKSRRAGTGQNCWQTGSSSLAST